MSEKVELQKKAKGQRPEYFEGPAIEKNLSITMALAGEVAVLRDRLDTLERLLEADGAVSRSAIDNYVPAPEVREERDAWRDEYLGNVLRIVHQEREELQKAAASERPNYDEAIKLVENE
ncbi:hypothetical protein [Erythrobacter rubeus]|uniref:Uncharacterized protein n=1 Tax=Erythrobacter rubeus TaxID=2760803 RepID=A0ABR8KT61_9SPHN|nr:hypothetical protein [Erythrobacter rubeus]MBD2842617.1 hypothetical protein [Erythrobacter rubeus]